MTARHYPSFVNSKTDEDKLANIIISTSLMDEVISLNLTNHFLILDDSERNDNDRDIFEKDILTKLSFREKIDIVSKFQKDEDTRKRFKSSLVRVGEIRNQVAHKTGMLDMPRDIEALYDEFDRLMTELEWFIESTYSEFQYQMDYAYDLQYRK